MAFCPNISNKQVRQEFNELKNKVGEDLAYYLWDKYEGDYELASQEAARIAGNVQTEVIESADSDVNSYDSNYRKKTNNRRQNWTAEEIQLSERVSTVLTELFPELSKEYVQSIEGGYIGEVDLDALRILIDEFLEKPDTIPHEYAHYYINMFWDSKLVQEGLTEFGSEEALVTALGQKALESGGKARTWWQKFKDFIKSIFADNETKRQLLLAELTDGFVTRKQLSEAKEVLSGVRHQKLTKKQLIDAVNKVITDMQQKITFDEGPHAFYDKETGEKIKSVTEVEKQYGFNTFNDENATSEQKKQYDDNANAGTRIHYIFEQVFNGKFQKSSHEKMHSSAIDSVKQIAEKIMEQYDILGSEVIVYDKNNKIAGIIDVLAADKKTGELVILDIKTKYTNYKRGSYSKKGYGFQYVTSSKFSVTQQRDAYEFQTAMYSKILQNHGLNVSRRYIIPVNYEFVDGQITSAEISPVFGNNEDVNKSLKQNNAVALADTVRVKANIADFFGETKTDQKLAKFEEFSKKITKILDDIRVRLENQQRIFSLRRSSRRNAYKASKLLEQISGLNEVDALYKYLEAQVKTLRGMNSAILQRSKTGDINNFDLDILREYNEIAASYGAIGEIINTIRLYESILGTEIVNKIVKVANEMMIYQQSIMDAYKTYGSEMYTNTYITPYVQHVKVQMRILEKKKYISENPKQPSETDKQFKNRVQKHLDEWEEENKDEILEQTRQWVDGQKKIADSSFEVNYASMWLSSIYESNDPFVSSIVKLYDSRLRSKNRVLIEYRHQQAKLFKEFKEKYGNSGFNYKKLFEDFYEIIGDKVYFVNKYCSQFIVDSKNIRKSIYEDPSLNMDDKRKKYKEWLDKNAPINDKEGFKQKLKAEVTAYLENLNDGSEKNAIKRALEKDEDLHDQLEQLLKLKVIKKSTISEINDIIDDLTDEYRQPLTNEYPNTKYNAIMSLNDDDPKKKLFLFFSEIYEKADQYKDVIPEHLQLGFRLPTIKARGMEVMSTKGIIKGISNKFDRGVLLNPDDALRNQSVFQDENGNVVKQVPLHYANFDIKLDEQSFDLPTIIYKWYDQVLTYTMKRSMETQILMTSEILHSRRIAADDVLSKLNQKARDAMHLAERPASSNTAGMFDAWVDQVFYGNKINGKTYIKLFNTERYLDVNKALRQLLTMQSTRVMHANYMSGLINVLVGEGNQIEEMFAGETIDHKSYFRATKFFVENVPEWSEDFFKIAPESFLGKLAEYFEMFDINDNQSLTGLLRHSASDYGYMINTIGEHEFQIRYMLAALMKLQAKDKDGNVLGSMFDYISFDDNGKLIVKPEVANFSNQEQDEFSLQVRRDLMLMHGNYSERSATKASAYFIGSAIQQLRKWIEPSVRKRFQGEQIDEYSKKKTVGFYRTTSHFIFTQSFGRLINVLGGLFTQNHNNIVKIVQWNELEDHEKTAVIRGITELGICLLSVFASMLFGKSRSDGGDDDSWSWDNPFIAYMFYRIYSDFSFYWNPKSMISIIRDPLPALSFALDVQKLLTQLPFITEEYQSGHHMFKNKFADKFVRMIPIVKQIPRLGNVQAEFDAFKNNN